jgi:hypothetical protein
MEGRGREGGRGREISEREGGKERRRDGEEGKGGLVIGKKGGMEGWGKKRMSEKERKT